MAGIHGNPFGGKWYYKGFRVSREAYLRLTKQAAMESLLEVEVEAAFPEEANQ